MTVCKYRQICAFIACPLTWRGGANSKENALFCAHNYLARSRANMCILRVSAHMVGSCASTPKCTNLSSQRPCVNIGKYAHSARVPSHGEELLILRNMHHSELPMSLRKSAQICAFCACPHTWWEAANLRKMHVYEPPMTLCKYMQGCAVRACLHTWWEAAHLRKMHHSELPMTLRKSAQICAFCAFPSTWGKAVNPR